MTHKTPIPFFMFFNCYIGILKTYKTGLEVQVDLRVLYAIVDNPRRVRVGRAGGGSPHRHRTQEDHVRVLPIQVQNKMCDLPVQLVMLKTPAPVVNLFFFLRFQRC